jgi:hypothetical protein
MNETRSTHRRDRIKGRFAVVLCLMMVVGLLPLAAFAVPTTVTDAAAMYVNSATISLTPACSYRLDGGPTVAATTSVTTSVYGAHVLELDATWKPVSATEATRLVMTIPFFVDDDVAPIVACDAVASYVMTASITVTATDNFNGSGIDSLYYRVDGGNLVQVVSPASITATRLLIARLPKVAAATAPPLTTFDQTPPHMDYGPCGLCHELAGPGPEPTSTPAPVGTKTFVVTGVGAHTVEYWATDIARNESVHATRTFAVGTVPTRLSIRSNHSSTTRYHTISLYGWLKPGLPLGSHVVVQAKKPGSSTWVTLSTRHTSATGYWSYPYKVRIRGSYYFRAKFAGSVGFGSVKSSSVKVSVK